MKSSSSKLPSSSNSSKSKKNSKDRDKRKSQSSSETVPQTNSEKGSPNKDANCSKYVGYGPEQLTAIAEQSMLEHLTEEVCLAFTEDINYKLRHIIYDALAKARLSGRNYISSTDIDDTFECLQIHNVYGAQSSPHWISLGDQNLYYLDDTKINLIEKAEESYTYEQPLEPIVTRKWLPETKEVSKNLKVYFVVMCKSIIEKDEEVRRTALINITENNLIGPIVEWFYHFGYILLSKDITYDSFTVCAFDLLRALELNDVAMSTVSDKQIILLAKLLLQRLLRSIILPEVLKPMCRLLAMLCRRVTLRKIILKKIISKFGEIKDEYALHLMCAINALGIDAIFLIFIPNFDYFTSLMDCELNPEITFEILRCYHILCSSNKDVQPITDRFYNIFGDGVVPIWKRMHFPCSESSKLELNWLNFKVRLIKSRQKRLPPTTVKQKKIHIEEAFPEVDETEEEILNTGEKTQNTVEKIQNIDKEVMKPSITFKFQSFAPAVGRLRFLKLAKSPTSQNAATHIIIGKRTLISPVLQKFNTSKEKCIDHSLMFYNL